MASKRGNPNMRKGAPSVNELGRAAPVIKATAAAAGVDGVAAYGGFVMHGENNRHLQGREKWVTYANAMNVAIVATGLRYFGNLLAGTDWHAEPNEAGGKDAERGAEIVTEGLLKAPMLKPWPLVVRKAAMYRALGFSLHAFAFRRRPDGMIIYGAIEHRPQHTIERWIRASEDAPFDSVMQRARESGREIIISLDECFYCVDDTLTDNPDGVGLMRHVIEKVRRLEVYEKLEGIAYASDLAGTPIARAPLAEIVAGATGNDDAKAAKVETATRSLKEVIQKRNKTPEDLAWALLDSATYKGADPNTITAIQKWAIEILKSETANLPDISNVIQRELLQIARVLGVEFVMQGGDGKGSFAQHEDKTSMFATNLQTTLTEIGWFATTQLARRLVARNGLDPDTCAPTLIAEPISTDAVETATRSLANLALAGLAPNDPARNVLRKRMRLPPEPDQTIEISAPRRPGPPRAEVIDPNGKVTAPDPTLTEEEAITADSKTPTPTKKRKRAA